MTEPGSHDWIMEQADRIIAVGESAPRAGRDPVNEPMVRNWVEAMGDRNPVYADAALAEELHGGPVAPPAMAQVWTMPGLHGGRALDDPLSLTMNMLDEAGYTSVVATNSEQTYDRYLRHGEQVAVTARLESVVGPKETALGEGYFATTLSTWYVGDEPVATMKFRVLKFKPAASTPEASAAGDVLRPQVNRDTEFFWDGARKGELRIQKCGACGVLRHPPGPGCPRCGATEPTYVVSEGRGTVHSHVVHRHPPVPGRELPVLLVLVQLEEGVRMVGELLDATAEDLRIGAPVEVAMLPVDDELTLPAWRMA